MTNSVHTYLRHIEAGLPHVDAAALANAEQAKVRVERACSRVAALRAALVSAEDEVATAEVALAKSKGTP